MTLEKTLDPEALWTINHRGSVNGQLIYFHKDAVYFITQKLCLDFGSARGLPMTPLYSNGKQAPKGRMGDFESDVGNGDLFMGCVSNTTPWRSFKLKSFANDTGTPVPPNALRYVRLHRGKHEGEGVWLRPYEFDYTADALERMFQKALREAALRNSTLENGAPEIRSGVPILLNGYPFETGHSLITTLRNKSCVLCPDWVDDISVLAWNRLQEAVASLAGRPPPSVLLPEAIKKGDLLAITVLAFISIFTFGHALSTAASAGRERVLRWKRQRLGAKD